jgi:predicted nucleic-acid-binding Zn-ribbon protein
MKIAPCPNCGGTELFRSIPIQPQSGISNPFIGLGSFFMTATFHVVICRACGMTRFFADPDACDKLERSSYWNPVR